MTRKMTGKLPDLGICSRYKAVVI